MLSTYERLKRGLPPLTVHELKCWPEYFAALEDGKGFEVRRDDRDYKVGDRLWLREWLPERNTYTGRETSRVITYVLKDFIGVTKGYAVLGLQ